MVCTDGFAQGLGGRKREVEDVGSVFKSQPTSAQMWHLLEEGFEFVIFQEEGGWGEAQLLSFQRGLIGALHVRIEFKEGAFLLFGCIGEEDGLQVPCRQIVKEGMKWLCIEGRQEAFHAGAKIFLLHFQEALFEFRGGQVNGFGEYAQGGLGLGLVGGGIHPLACGQQVEDVGVFDGFLCIRLKAADGLNIVAEVFQAEWPLTHRGEDVQDVPSDREVADLFHQGGEAVAGVSQFSSQRVASIFLAGGQELRREIHLLDRHQSFGQGGEGGDDDLACCFLAQVEEHAQAVCHGLRVKNNGVPGLLCGGGVFEDTGLSQGAGAAEEEGDVLCELLC